MSKVSEMTIEFGELLEPDDFEGFEIDPLGELTAFERGLQRFAHDHDRRISLRIGRHVTTIEAFRDLIPILCDLPRGLADLAAGKTMNLELPELGQSVKIYPRTDVTVRCELRGFDPGDIYEYVLPKQTVIDVITGFICDFLRQGVSAGCVAESDAETFIAAVKVS